MQWATRLSSLLLVIYLLCASSVQAGIPIVWTGKFNEPRDYPYAEPGCAGAGTIGTTLTDCTDVRGNDGANTGHLMFPVLADFANVTSFSWTAQGCFAWTLAPDLNIDTYQSAAWWLVWDSMGSGQVNLEAAIAAAGFFPGNFSLAGPFGATAGARTTVSNITTGLNSIIAQPSQYFLTGIQSSNGPKYYSNLIIGITTDPAPTGTPIGTVTPTPTQTPCATCTPPIGSPLGAMGSCPGGNACCP